MGIDLKQISTAALAYLGDSVWELSVRQMLVEKGISDSARLNREALCYVTAGAQAAAVKRILGVLSEDEQAIYKRGRMPRAIPDPEILIPIPTVWQRAWKRFSGIMN